MNGHENEHEHIERLSFNVYLDDLGGVSSSSFVEFNSENFTLFGRCRHQHYQHYQLKLLAFPFVRDEISYAIFGVLDGDIGHIDIAIIRTRMRNHKFRLYSISH